MRGEEIRKGKTGEEMTGKERRLRGSGVVGEGEVEWQVKRW